MSATNKFSGLRLEFHIIQSFPVTCLNRDDTGAPKTAIVGGTTRARVSSQSWKRAIRTAMHNDGTPLGHRTRAIKGLIYTELLSKGASLEDAETGSSIIENLFVSKADSERKSIKNEVDEDSTDEVVLGEQDSKTSNTLFISDGEIRFIADKLVESGFNVSVLFSEKGKATDVVIKKRAKKLADMLKEAQLTATSPVMDAADIALFGRMVAQASGLTLHAAASFSHAISTHKVNSEIDFFTALDDIESDSLGAAHMGTLEYNSATYYRYVSVDLGQLYTNMGGANIIDIIQKFTRALFIATPEARQTTMAGFSPWDFGRVILRKGHSIQIPFDAPIKRSPEGYSEPSITFLKNKTDAMQRMYGTLYGQKALLDIGDNAGSFDDLFTFVQDNLGELND